MKILNSYQSISNDISPQLDSLRGLSALIVLFAHANQILVAPSTMIFYSIVGLLSQGAVMVFFVLSGFLIGKSLTKSFHTKQSLDLKKFLKNRFNRIYPPFIFSFIIIGILYLLAPFYFVTNSLDFINSNQNIARQDFAITLTSFISTLLFLNGFVGETISVNGPLWSLSYEVWYYILAALIFKSSKPLYAFLTLILFVTLSFLNKDFLVHSIIWFLGLFLCIIHNHSLFHNSTNKLIYAVGFIGTLFFSYIFVSTQYNLPRVNFLLLNNYSLILYKLSLGLLTTCYIYSILRGSVKFPTTFKNSSAYSYTLYIIHFPILLFIFGILQLRIQGNFELIAFVYFLSCSLIVLISKIAARRIEKIKLIQ